MMTFLFFIGVAAVLIVGGTRGSLYLRTRRVSTGRRLGSLRRSYVVPVDYEATADSELVDETTRYNRKMLGISLLFLGTVGVIIMGVLSVALH
jgi:hypothetical protein